MSLLIRCRLLVGLVVFVSSPFATALSLDEAVEIAWLSDPFLARSKQQQSALQRRAEAANQLPDPQVRIGYANLPTDTFDIDQEPFTQFQLGLTQMFPRGKSRELGMERLRSLSEVESWARQGRKATIRLELTRLWVALYVIQESQRLIESDRGLFEYLVEAAEASYIAADGKSQQYDVVRAQLELTRLEERLIGLKDREQTLRAALSEWLGPDAMDLELTGFPSVPKLEGEAVFSHPNLLGIQQEIDSLEVAVELEEQKYKPAWSVSTSYGRRAKDQLGQSRADFLSLAVSFDVPLFTGKKQDQLVAAARADKEVKRLDYDLLSRRMTAELNRVRQQEAQLERRIDLYQDRLLGQISEQAEAALTAYTNDRGDFSEVIRARIAELEARLSFVEMSAQVQKVRSEIQYYLAGGE